MTTSATVTVTTAPPAPPNVEEPPVEPGPDPWGAPPPPPSRPPVPIPVLAPYLGLVAAVLCTLGGGWLLLAPYALDLRHGAAHLPRTAAVDLECGAAIVVVGIVTAMFFSVNLVTRLRADLIAQPELDVEPEPASEPEAQPEADAVPEPETEIGPEPEPEPSAEARQPDPGGALRELLTPLVAALAADLRSHDQERLRSGGNDAEDAHRRREP